MIHETQSAHPGGERRGILIVVHESLFDDLDVAQEYVQEARNQVAQLFWTESTRKAADWRLFAQWCLGHGSDPSYVNWQQFQQDRAVLEEEIERFFHRLDDPHPELLAEGKEKGIKSPLWAAAAQLLRETHVPYVFVPIDDLDEAPPPGLDGVRHAEGVVFAPTHELLEFVQYHGERMTWDELDEDPIQGNPTGWPSLEAREPAGGTRPLSPQIEDFIASLSNTAGMNEDPEAGTTRA